VFRDPAVRPLCMSTVLTEFVAQPFNGIVVWVANVRAAFP
jgi:hypothetical protein